MNLLGQPQGYTLYVSHHVIRGGHTENFLMSTCGGVNATMPSLGPHHSSWEASLAPSVSARGA